MRKGMFIRVGVGDAYVMIGSEGVSYAPDLAHDMALRAYQSLGETIQQAIDTGYIQIEEDEEIDWDPDGPNYDDDSEEEEEEVNDGPSRWWIQ